MLRCLARLAVLSLIATAGLGQALKEVPLYALKPGDQVPAIASDGIAEQPPLGLWYYHQRFDTGPGGALTIVHRGARWTLKLGSASLKTNIEGHNLIFSLPNGDSFRGTFDHAGLHGFWIRRPIFEDARYPLGQTQAYATPLRFQSSGSDQWRAEVKPLDDTFTLYLKIFQDPDGSVKAAFRNPEQNSHGVAMRWSVSRSGNKLQFTGRRDPSQPEVRMDATLYRSGDSIVLFWQDMNHRLVLHRASPEEARYFLAREPGAKYVYRVPDGNSDGWQVVPAGQLGIDEVALARAVQRVVDMDPTSARPWPIHSMSIAYKGKLVLDEYFYGYNADEPHDTRSASKTFSSIMLGALIREGASLSPQTKVLQVMAPAGPFANPDQRKEQITLGHLLTHSAGLACDDNAESSPGNEDMIESDRSRPDWTKRTLDLPMAFAPGAHYAYCSMNINLAGAVLSQATGEWLPALFDRTVAKPLQFGAYHWNLAANGEGYMGGGVFVRPRDFLKIGQAYLDGGAWNHRRIVDASWVNDSWSPHAHISPATTGLAGDAFLESYYEVDEGWAWHMIGIKTTDKIYPALHANGNGGQLLIVVPELDLAVMFSAGAYGTGLWNAERDNIVGGMIIPALPKH